KLRLLHPVANLSRIAGDSIRLKCEVSAASSVRFYWYKNEAPLKEERGRLLIRRYSISKKTGNSGYGSRIRIGDAETHDTGYYRCDVVDGHQTLSSTGILIVKMGRWDRIQSESDLPDMQPLFPILVGSSPVFEGPSKNRGPVEVLDANTKPFGFCQKYAGSACSKFVANRTIFVRSDKEQITNENKLMEAITVIASSGDLSRPCSDFAMPSLCLLSFPPCDESTTSDPLPKLICRHECELLENDICRMEFAIAKTHPVIGQKVVLPNCQDLPTTNCLQLGIPKPQYNAENDQACYTGKGEEYRGSIRQSKNGHQCQLWSHQLRYKSSDYPELIGGHNYCRNPGSVEDQPWCYTTNPLVRKEVCSVSKCNDFLWLYVFIPTAVGVATLGVLVGLLCIKRRISRKTDSNSGSSMLGQQPLELSSLLPKSAIRAREFAISDIQFKQELGEGAFGKVYEGEVQGLDGVTRVAIKTLKENATAKTVQDFRREVDLMTDLRHPNIVCLFGVCVKEDPLCMLFEFMIHGDLHEFLVTHSPHGLDSDEPRVLGHTDFLYVALQVAAGMEYLAGHHYIHRDLAARNCLVGKNLVVKISDFGLSRDIYSSDYYRVQSKSLLPVRWMPPESILYGKFTTDSDVWSYGVVLWETYSYGLQPYYGRSNQEVIEMIRSRQLLPCPDGCPPHMYSLMIECWHEVPARRPSFKEIHSRLRTWDGLLSACNNMNSGNNRTLGRRPLPDVPPRHDPRASAAPFTYMPEATFSNI
uniref:Tyrosine-protein kinase receptor n=1 Tax=Strigamia maritima TaxID=126957 RepID=T1IJ71_STRMM